MVNDESDAKIEVDFSRKETEAGWIEVVDRFGLNAAPVWFTWIGWIFALGALQFFFEKSRSVSLAAVIGVSYFLLWLYFWGFFFRFRFKGLPFSRRPAFAKFFSILISSALAILFWRAAILFSAEIAKFQQGA